MHRMGKFSPVDELNCGACGYDTCLEHAIAIHKELAESEMCLPNTIDQLRIALTKLKVSHEELATTQEALLQSEKLAGMGQLAAGIAHEVNNPLGVVLMYAHLLLDECDPQSKIREDLAMITEQADRCKKIVAGLLHFARQNKVCRSPVDIREVVDRTMHAMTVPECITVRIEHDVAEPIAEVDRDQIVQVLTNLVTNAVAAMDDAERHADDPHNRRPPQRPHRRDRHRRRNSAREPEEDLRSVLHHETNGKRHGPGAGRELRHHQNAQRRHPRPIAGRSGGRSHRFHLHRNAAARGMTGMSSVCAITARRELQRTTTEEKSMTISSENPTVLLVDDDDDFLFQHRLQLESAGFHVIAAQGQKPAEEILARLRPDVAVVDVMMENPDAGFVLCHHIRKKDPSIPVILVTSVNSETGMDFDLATEEDRVWIKADALLAKPIRFEQLLGEIDRLLAVKK